MSAPKQVRTAAEVARAVISTASLDDLLRRAVELIRTQFGYDFVSIFLLEQEGDFAVLSEATGDTGLALKAEGYLVPVGSQSVIGWVTSNNQPARGQRGKARGNEPPQGPDALYTL